VKTQTGTSPRRTFREHALRVAPFMLLGPISGPLAAGVVLNFIDGRPILACMYAVLFVELTLATPYLAVWLTKAALSLQA
jgi:hypothetical protein